MNNQTQTSTSILAYQVDTSSVQLALTSNARISDSYENIKEAADKVGLSVEGFQALTGISVDAIPIQNQKVADSFDDIDTSVKSVIHDIGDLGRDIETIPEPDLSAFGVAADTGGGAGGGGSSTGSRRGLTALGSLAGGSPGLSDAARLVSVTAAFGPLGLAAGAAALVLGTAKTAEEERTKATQGFIDAVKQSAGQTTPEIQKNIATLQSQKDALTESSNNLSYQQYRIRELDDLQSQGLVTSEDYNRKLKDINASVYDLTGGALGLKDGLGSAVIGTSNFDEILGQNKTAITAVNVAIGLLNTLFGTQANKAADAAAALAKVTKTQEDAANKALEIDQLTKAQRDERAASDERQINILTRIVGAGGLTGDALTEVAGKIDGLNADLTALSGVTYTAADATAALLAAQEASTKQNQSYLDLLASEGRTRDAISTDIQAITDLRTAATAKEADITADNSAKIADIEQQGADKRADIAQTAADNIAKIERDAGRSEFSAKANRDAVAFDQAKTKEKDALDDEKKADTKSLAQEVAAETKSLATQQTAYNKQIQQTETALSTQTQIQQHKLLQDQTDLINITSAELAISQNAGIGIVDAHVYMLQGIESAVLSYGVRIVSGLNNIFNSFQPLPAASNGGSQGAINAAQAKAIFRSQMTTALGLNNPGGNSLR